jgi:hypothetical protein
MLKYTYLNSTALFVAISVVVFYFFTICSYAINVPYTDDFAVLMSIFKIIDSDNWSYIFDEIFAFHNEHRLATPRLIGIVILYLNDQNVDIRYWLIIGNFMLVFAVILLFLGAFNVKNEFYLYVPVVILFFQPLHFELMYWSMASLQNTTAIFLVFLTLYLLIYKNTMIAALLVGTLAVYTSANGLFAFVIGMLVLINERRWKALILWSLFFIAHTYLYWSGYRKLDSSASENDILMPLFDSVLSLGVHSFEQSIGRVILGCSLLTIVVVNGVLCFRSLKQGSTKPILYLTSVFAFLLLMVLVLFAGRNTCVLCISRYRIYIVLLLAVTYLLWLPQLRSIKFGYQMTLVTCVIFSTHNYINYTHMLARHKKEALMQLTVWRSQQRIESLTNKDQEMDAVNFWNKIYHEGYYKLPVVQQ